ncbi:MAG: hypothetical protein JXX14_13275 [Deltaproteobacteria bacterium]|nr:hypothetical protein [Deltaproteobacteria bacterium]
MNGHAGEFAWRGDVPCDLSPVAAHGADTKAVVFFTTEAIELTAKNKDRCGA